MIAHGFKPVGWVAAVAGAALGCYMLSLNVASERADLLRVERQIVTTKQDIRSLQTELGTRGRLAQLEEWNADVLALSAPASAQFVDNEVKLARFEQRAPTIDDRAEVRMAALQTDQARPAEALAAPVVQAAAPVPPPVPLVAPSLVHRASLEVPPPANLHDVATAHTAAIVAAPRPLATATAPSPARSRDLAAKVKEHGSIARSGDAKVGEGSAKPKATGDKIKEASAAMPKPTPKAPAVTRPKESPIAAAVPKKKVTQVASGKLDSRLAREIRIAAKAESGSGTR